MGAQRLGDANQDAMRTRADAGRAIQVRGWPQITGRLELHPPTGFAVEPGDACSVHAGRDRRLDTYLARLANVLNFRGEPYIPGQDLLMSFPDAR